MIKKIFRITTILYIVICLMSSSAFGKIIRADWTKEKLSKGYSIEDAYSIMAIMVLSGENVSSIVEYRYKKTGDWEEVASYFEVDIDEFNEFVEEQLYYEKVLEIPDDIYKQMRASGMNDEECGRLSTDAFNSKFDIRTVWEAKQNGITIDDLIEERTKLKTEKLQAATDLTFGEISEEEYLEKMQSLSPDMKMSDIIEFAINERRGWMNFRKKACGISDEEIVFAEKSGMKDFFAICRLKSAENISNLSFKEMVLQVQSGVDVDKVISDNISVKKVDMLRQSVDSSNEEYEVK